ADLVLRAGPQPGRAGHRATGALTAVRVAVGLDVGTTGARAVAVDEIGSVVAEAAAAYGVASPRPGWTEQDPLLWWNAAREMLDALEVPEAWLPAVAEGPDATGVVVAGDAGIAPGVVVAAGGGDNAAAAVGAGITSTGRLSSSIGTSGVLFAHTDEVAVDPS